MKVAVQIVFLLKVFDVVFCGSPCPLAVSILPCDCLKQGRDTMVTCSFKSDSVHQKAMSFMKGQRMIIDEFRLVRSSLTELSSKFWHGLVLRSITLQESTIKNISFPDLYRGQESSLEGVAYDKVSMSGLASSVVPKLAYLERFECSRSIFEKIYSNFSKAFLSPQNLRFLKLSRNEIMVVEKSAFSGFTSLMELDLSGNLMTQLDNVLPLNHRVITFDFSNNRLKKLPVDVTSAKSGSSVNLEKNIIQEIDSASMTSMLQADLQVNLRDPIKPSWNQSKSDRIFVELCRGVYLTDYAERETSVWVGYQSTAR